MKTKACFYIRVKLNDEIGAVAKDGYIERVGKRVYGYDKRDYYWCITDINTGLLIDRFPKIKDCQEYIKEHSFKIEQFCKNRKDVLNDEKFNRAVAVLKENKQ